RTRRMQGGDYGRYTEVKIEKDLISRTAKEKRCVVHFFHRDFRRCKIMDGHLEKLAPKHFDTLFLRADVANVPFLVTKLAIKTLPCVIGFVDGTTKMKIVGFDELPGGDNFATSTLEQGMQECGK
ncbi:thioredoxin-like protein, partial [Rhodotorula sp. JG-1b]